MVNENMKEIYKLIGHTDFVLSVTISLNDRYCLSSSSDRTIKLWDLWNGKEIKSFNKSATSLSFSPINDLVLSGSSDKIIRLWNIENGEEIFHLKGHPFPISNVKFSRDGTKAMSGGHGVVFLWDIINGKEITHFTVFKGPSLHLSMDFSPDGRKAIFGGDENTIYFYDLENLKLLHKYKGYKTSYKRHQDKTAFSSIISLSFSLDGKIVISGGMDKLIRFWDLENNREFRSLNIHKGWINSLSISPDGKKLLCGSTDKSVTVINIDSENEIERFIGHTNFVSSACFLHDGCRALSGSWDNTIRLLKLEN
jgi:WD40 repeat protein